MGALAIQATTGLFLLSVGLISTSGFKYVCDLASFLCGFREGSLIFGLIHIVVGAVVLLIIPLSFSGFFFKKESESPKSPKKQPED